MANTIEDAKAGVAWTQANIGFTPTNNGLVSSNASGSKANGTARADTLALLLQNALDTGDYSALAEWSPTGKELDAALAKTTYKNIKGLSDAQKNQFAASQEGRFNKYVDNTSTEIIDTWKAGASPTSPSGSNNGIDDVHDAEAANQLATNSGFTDQMRTIRAALGDLENLPDSYTGGQYIGVNTPQIRDLQALQQQLGTNVNYDYDAIKAIYDEASRAGYDIEQQSGAEKSYYQHLADAQNTALETIRNNYAGAIAQGASRGMQAANQLSTILGIGNTANEEATQLAIDRQTRANEYAAQVAANARNALEYSNSQQMDLANLARTLYNDDIQRETAELAYNQGINTDAANYAAAATQARGNLQSSLANTYAGIYNNNQSATAQLQAAIAQAEAQKRAAELQRSQYGK